ncbi:MAG: hypothetical protein ACFE68_04310 [Candidatus Hodarchaeota archaeon]
MARDRYKYGVFKKFENANFKVIPFPTSGGGKKGECRPDFIAGNGRIRIVCEMKDVASFPIRLSESDVQPVKIYADYFSALGFILAKLKKLKTWKLFKIEDLTKSGKNSYLITEETWEVGLSLKDFLNKSNKNQINLKKDYKRP